MPFGDRVCLARMNGRRCLWTGAGGLVDADVESLAQVIGYGERLRGVVGRIFHVARE